MTDTPQSPLRRLNWWPYILHQKREIDKFHRQFRAWCRANPGKRIPVIWGKAGDADRCFEPKETPKPPQMSGDFWIGFDCGACPNIRAALKKIHYHAKPSPPDRDEKILLQAIGEVFRNIEPKPALTLLEIRKAQLKTAMSFHCPWLCGEIAQLEKEEDAVKRADKPSVEEPPAADILREVTKAAYWYGEETGDYDMEQAECEEWFQDAMLRLGRKEPPPAAGPWQPIETAPKGNRVILGFLDYKKFNGTPCPEIDLIRWVHEHQFWISVGDGETVLCPISAWAEIIPPTPEQITEWKKSADA